MKSRKWFYLIGIIGALMLVVAIAPLAFAQGPEDEGGFGPGRGPGFGPMFGHGPGHGMRHSGFGGSGQSLIVVAADVLGMDQADLVAELQAGQSLADVAEAQGVDPQAIVDAFVAGRAALLAERVANGQLTQAQADAMLEVMTANITAHLSEPWPSQGFGPGSGFVDEDGDGLCDHHPAGRSPRYQPAQPQN